MEVFLASFTVVRVDSSVVEPELPNRYAVTTHDPPGLKGPLLLLVSGVLDALGMVKTVGLISLLMAVQNMPLTMGISLQISNAMFLKLTS